MVNNALCYFYFLTDPTDPKLRKIDDSFLLGSILVATWYNYLITVSKVILLLSSPSPLYCVNSDNNERRMINWNTVVMDCCFVQPRA